MVEVPPRQIPQQHRSRGAGDTIHVVVFGYPETGITVFFHVLCQVQRVAQGLGGIAIGADRHQIEG